MSFYNLKLLYTLFIRDRHVFDFNKCGIRIHPKLRVGKENDLRGVHLCRLQWFNNH